MKRKVISLQTSVVTENDEDAPGGSYWMLRYTALCDDGSMWRGFANEIGDDVWVRIADIPEN